MNERPIMNETAKKVFILIEGCYQPTTTYDNLDVDAIKERLKPVIAAESIKISYDKLSLLQGIGDGPQITVDNA